MSRPFARELAVAIDAVREAAQLCRSVQAEISAAVLEKKDRSPVTVADFGSQALICRTLAAAFPDDPVIAEEDSASLNEPDNASILEKVLRHVRTSRGETETKQICNWIDHGRTRQYAQRFWTLDPIDGTKGFLRSEQYAVALALIIDGKIEVAALACPNLPIGFASRTGASAPPAPSNGVGSIFTAVRGHGSFVQPIDKASDPVRIRVSALADLAQARFCESVESGHSSHNDSAEVAKRLNISASPVRMDSQAKYAVVARGEADIYLRLPTRADYQEKIWDHAAGALIVSEAGGTVTDVTGRPLEFHHGPELVANRGVIVSNGPVHDRVIATLGDMGIAR